VAQYHKGDLEVRCRLTYEPQDREIRLKHNNGAVLPILLFATENESGAWFWAPSDDMLDQLTLFVMSSEGFVRSMMLEWVEKQMYNYRACTINGQRFGRECLWRGRRMQYEQQMSR